MSCLHDAVKAYKNKAMNQIVHNSEIVRAIGEPISSGEELLYQNIFPFFRIPDTVTETRTYITVCVDVPESFHPKDYIREVALKICIIVHQSMMETALGATRLDYIAAEIDRIFSDSAGYGLGRLHVVSSTETSLDQFHRMREIIFVSESPQSGC